MSHTNTKVDTAPKRSDEPIWWGLFGAGGTWFAMLTPITIFVIGVLVPMGLVEFDYERVSSFASTIIGGLFIIATLALPMWHAMHRLHHGMHDLKIHTGVVGKIACYWVASAITLLAIIFVLMV
ncbi:fumarate reductase subunit FrdD [Vibrio agarivorans]|uniref:fumarate reductase subunit FrdD n=1 Tax=Vibrio agarivorans TaxID=153622 RepID=UPI002230DAFF|nr:fumarate reductase subunit FrdD [Vibrio agarivorans]MDN3662076.1 fumarate reductase subunit FrdD [Vibrio agarivorans]